MNALRRPALIACLCLIYRATLFGFPVSFYYEPTPGTGFFDPMPTAQVGGNTGATLGEQRKIALEYAVRWWASRLAGNVTIQVKVRSEYDDSGGLLANAVPQVAVENWTVGSPPPLQGVYYPGILAAQISGVKPPSLDPPYDVVIRMNTYWDDTLASFYYGLDGKPALVQNDFVEVMLHEFAHGLGLVKGSLRADGTFAGGDPSIITLLTTDSAGNPIAAMTAAQRVAVMKSNGALIGGAILQANNGGQRARWHSPDPYVEGASFAHFDEVTYSYEGSLNSLMTPAIDATPTHVVGPLTLDLLRDMGYIFTDNLPPVIGIDFPVDGRAVRGSATLRGTATDTAPGGSANAVGMLKVRAALYSVAEGKWYRWVPGSFDSAVFDAATHVKDAALDNIPVPTGTRRWSLNLPAGLAEGSFQLHVSGVDQLHHDTTYVSRTFAIDNTAPTVDFTPYAASTPVFDASDLKVESSDATSVILSIQRNVSGTEYWDGTTWITSGSPIELSMSAEGGGSFKPAVQLPGRADWLSGSTIQFSATATDAASNVTSRSLTLSRTPVDTTTPLVTISSPPAGAVYAERTIAVPFGEALDPETDIASVGIYLMRLVPGDGFKYWDGHAWSDTAVYLPANYQAADHRWWTPALGYRLPSDTELPDATYKVQATAMNREVPQQGSTLVERTFHIAVDPPRVDVTSVTHNGWAKAGWTLSGTVTDTAEVGFSDGNRVTLSINRDGLYWDGDEWRSNPVILYAEILPDDTWIYPGTTPGALMPTGDGLYAVSAHVKDNNANVNAIIAGGLPGNNQVIFTVDATPPQLHVLGPAPDAVVSSAPLAAGWVNGTAFDSSGPVTVTFRLKMPAVGPYGDELFWNEEAWQVEFAFFGSDIDLVGTFPGDGGPTSWKFTGINPKLGWETYHCLVNGAYEVVAVATDPAGNETTLTRPFTVDYHPPYLPPGVENLPLHPSQAPPIAAGSVSTSEVARFVARIDENDPRGTFAQKFAVGTGGMLFAASSLAPPGGGANGLAVQRLGTPAWRSERERSYVEATNTYYESWFPSGSTFSISDWRYNALPASCSALETDATGNVYALFVQQHYSNFQLISSPHALLVKYNAGGSVAWVRAVPDVQLHPSFIGTPHLGKMALLSDGAVGLLFDFVDYYYGPGGVSQGVSSITVMAVFETNGDTRYVRTFGVTDITAPAPSDFESRPVDFAADAAGNVFVASIETGRFTGYGEPQPPDVHRIIRKLSPTGVTLAEHITHTCDFPERWDKIATDPAGNLYLGGIFIGGIRTPTDPARQEMLKFDNNLVFQWRAFGPGRDPALGDMLQGMDAGPDGVMTVDNSGMAAFFTSTGVLKWARPIITGITSGGFYTFGGGSAIGAVFTGDPYLTGHVVKMSRAGDLQFDIVLTEDFDLVQQIRASASHIHILRQSTSTGEGYITQFDNPVDVTIPVLLDPTEPADQILLAGDALELAVINSGSLATGHQWRKYDNGSPVDIPGATLPKFTINSLVMEDAGDYDCIVTNPNGPATSRAAAITVLAPVALDLALDTPGRTWTTGGDAPFVGFAAQSPNGPAHDSVDATMNRHISRNQSSFIETTISGPGAVTFWWKSNTEAFMDDFTFSIDGNDLDYLSGEHDWAPITKTFGPGTHTLRWTYYKAGNSNTRGDRVWLDDISFSTALPLADALDAPGLTWTTSADVAAWTGVTSPSHDGVDSGVSGTIGNNQQSYVETTVNGPGTLTFWWKVSCEQTFDQLALTVGGAFSGSISGEVDWVQVTRNVPAGPQTLRWSYNKDGFGVGGLDQAWLDEVEFNASPTGFSGWASGFGLAGPDSQPTAAPMRDGISNLLKYAFNLSPSTSIQGAARHVMPGSGSSGMPSTQTIGPAGARRLRLEYIRSRNATDLTYTVQFGSGLNALDWSAASGTETVTIIDTNWERVVIEDTVTSSTSARRFGRVEISQNP